MENDLPIIVFDLNKPDNISPFDRSAASRRDAHHGRFKRRRSPMKARSYPSTERKMARAVEAMERDFNGLRTGRASTSLVERIQVEYYGTPTPLNQLADHSVPEAHQIVIQPWDRGVLGAIEKAIQKSDIGLIPNVDGTVVRLNIPPLTEERRRDIVKVGPQADGRGPGRDPQPPSGGRGPASNARTGTENSVRDESRREPEQSRRTRPIHRRGRQARRSQGAGRSLGGRVARPEARAARATDRRAPNAHAPHAPGEPTAVAESESPVSKADATGLSRSGLPPELPHHVAIIMDGNRRWARDRGLPELEGHARAGWRAIRSILRHAVGRGVRSVLP